MPSGVLGLSIRRCVAWKYTTRATDTWTTKSPMSTSRGFHSANVVDGRIYVIGGSRGSGPDASHVRTVEVYDPTTDTWTTKGDMPRAIGAGFSSEVDGKIYVFGGYGGARRVDEYDPATDTWTRKSDMPTSSRHALSTSALDGKIYTIGGYVPGVVGYPGVAIVEVYDPAMDTWTTASDMLTGRFGHRSSVVDGKIYVIGGMGYWIRTAYGIVEEYDPSKDLAGEVTVDKATLASMVEEFTVLPAYPNPFNPSTTITYGIDTDSKITVQIYDITGQLITTFLNKEQTQGWHSVVWNGTNNKGTQSPAGIYLSKITAGNDVKTNKLMLLK